MVNNLLIILLISCSCRSQKVNNTLQIINANVDKNRELELNIQITNKLDTNLIFYIPNLDDMCSNLLQFYIIDKDGNNYNFNNCLGDEQVDEIRITDKNSKELKKNQFIKIKYKISLDSFSLKLQRINIKEIRLVLDYSNTNIVGAKNIYNQKIESKITSF
jgi:invasion protein IalB